MKAEEARSSKFFKEMIEELLIGKPDKVFTTVIEYGLELVCVDDDEEEEEKVDLKPLIFDPDHPQNWWNKLT
jgi:hypothetical protein